MKKLLLFVFFFLMLFSVFAQNGFEVYHTYQIPELSLKFEMAHRLIEDLKITNDGTGKLYYEEPGTTKEKMTKSRPVNMIIIVKGADDKIRKEIAIDYNDIDIDLSGFSMHYVGMRKFLVISAGRHKFYLLNLSTFIPIGPLDVGVSGAASDAQDGSLSFVEIFNDGQYLIGYARNFGLFCYNLMDIYNPVQVDHICSEDAHDHKTYFFLDQRIDNIYNGLMIRNHFRGKCDPAEFLFQGVKLKLDENQDPIKRIIDDRSVELQKIESDGKSTPIRIDFQD